MGFASVQGFRYGPVPFPHSSMRRTLVILSFIAGISFSSLPVCAQGTDAASEQFVEVFLGVKKAEELEKSGDPTSAMAAYRAALATLARIKRESPNWQTDLVNHRFKTTSDAIARLQEKGGGGAMMGGTMKPGAADPGVLPPLDVADPLKGDVPPLPPMPKGRGAKNAPLIDSGDPLAGVKQRLADLESQLSQATDRLRDAQEKNQKLTKDMADAIDSKAKAEAECLVEYTERNNCDIHQSS